MRENNWYGILLIVSLLIFAGLACNYQSLQTKQSVEVQPISTEVIQTVENNVEEAFAQLEKSGKLSLVFTEPQMTSMLSNELQYFSEVNASDVHVFLRDGKVLITVKVQQNGLSFPAEISLNIQPDAKGGVSVNILSAKAGPFSIPNSFTDVLSENIISALNTEIEDELGNVYIDLIQVANGQIIIEGHLK